MAVFWGTVFAVVVLVLVLLVLLVLSSGSLALTVWPFSEDIGGPTEASIGDQVHIY